MQTNGEIKTMKVQLVNEFFPVLINYVISKQLFTHKIYREKSVTVKYKITEPIDTNFSAYFSIAN